MRQEIIDWVAALRSGEYEQTKSVLHDDVGYCCLGVFCETLGTLKRYEDGDYIYGGDSIYCLPECVRDKLNISVYGGYVHEKLSDVGKELNCVLREGRELDSMDLTTLNDNGVAFDKIADLIEEIEKAGAWK